MQAPTRILFIGLRWPEPQATAAGKRMIQLIEMTLKAGYEVHFASSAKPGSYPADLKRLGVVVHQILLNHSSFDAFLIRNNFSAVIFDRFQTEEQFGWRVREQLPDCRLILDTEDLHSLRESRRLALKNHESWNVDYWTKAPKFGRELASMLRCDCSLIISREEMALLENTLPWIGSTLLYLPFQMVIPDPWGHNEFGQRRDFVFVGNGNHQPNLDAIDILIQKIWPTLRLECPEAELHIYGAYLPNSLAKEHDPETGLHIRGHAPNLEAVLGTARVQLAPLRFGAGIKGKIVEALSFGLPSITTPVGSEGIYEGGAPAALEANPDRDFISKASRLYRESHLWEETRKEALRKAQDHFQGGDMYPEAFNACLAEPGEPTEPQVQLIKTILRDKAFDSSRYMSRWIEEKQKRNPPNSSAGTIFADKEQ